MDFGENNDYPQIIERIINESNTGKAISKMFAKFLTGHGFEGEVNKQVVGQDARGKEVTVLDLLRQLAYDLAINNGCYVHVAINNGMKVAETRHIPFKYCRFTKKDDLNYCSKVAVYDNWEKDSSLKFDKEKIVSYPVFNMRPEVLKAQIGGNGQMAFLFFDNQYLYPLAPIDGVYMDCDTEGQVSIYKNNQIRNGFTEKIVLRVQPPSNDDEREEFIDKIKKFAGPDGDPVLVLEDEVDENGEIKKTGAFAIDKITSQINDKLFENWEVSLKNNIRKAYYMPAVLIDYEESKLGTTSGEAIIQAVNYYNALTADFRESISEFFRMIFKHSENPVLNSSTFEIKKLNLYDSTPIASGTAKYQANI